MLLHHIVSSPNHKYFPIWLFPTPSGVLLIAPISQISNTLDNYSGADQKSYQWGISSSAPKQGTE
jgi:hypothetical protein